MIGTIRIPRKALEHFCTKVFMKLGLSQDEAADSAEILVAAQLRQIGEELEVLFPSAI
jgi:LDH2 family malate/lactate/ureidoglycolate dehydrogenase